MPTVVIAVLIVAFVAVLAVNWVSARRGHDPAASVNSFSRALNAMGRGAETPARGRGDADDLSRT